MRGNRHYEGSQTLEQVPRAVVEYLGDTRDHLDSPGKPALPGSALGMGLDWRLLVVCSSLCDG